MNASEIQAIAHAEVHALMQAAEHDIKTRSAQLAKAAEDRDWDAVSVFAREAMESVGAWAAYAQALAVVGGMDALLDDHTTQGVPKCS